MFVEMLLPSRATAGSGRINADGTMDITVNLRWPPTPGDVTMMRNQLTAASQALWDATEGQLRFGQVTLTSGPVNEDLADLWISAGDFRSGLSFFIDGSSLGTRGDHISLSTSDLLGFPIGTVIAHEFGHLAIGLGDEYDEQPRGIGPCLDGGMSEQNHCLMQQPGGFTQTEFCTAAAHDPLQGFVPATGRFETSQQTDIHTRSCWEQLVINLGGRVPTLAAPAGLPAAASPAGFVGPVFEDETTVTDTVMLVLDRSDSMNWNTESDTGEVCGDGIDNDGDGMIDEDDCSQPRLAFLKAAARAWINLANNRGVKAGIMSFNHNVSYDLTFRPITDANLAGFEDAVRDLTASGLTAIGDALRQSIPIFPAGGVNKTALLISDGFNTSGEAPADVVPALTAAEIRVFTISTGSASDDDTLSEVAGATHGARVDSSSATTLVNAFAQQWANYRNETIIEPQKPYRTDQSISNSVVSFNLETNTPHLTLVVAGNMHAPADFGMRVVFLGPGGQSFDTDLASPQLRVVRDQYFLLAELKTPAPGAWQIRLYAAAGVPWLQTGHLTLLTDHPDTDLFTSLDRYVVDDSSIPVNLRVSPIHHTALFNLASLTAEVKRPDGSIALMPVASDPVSVGKGTYSAQISDLPLPGLYEVRVKMQTGPLSYNDPGEAIWNTSLPAAVTVPLVERIATQYFFVRSNTPPQGCLEIRCPTNQIRYVCGTNRTQVYFSVWATNLCNPTNLLLVTTPSSGSWFSLGTTTVNSWAFGSGKSNHCSFTVTVLPNPSCPPPTTNCVELHCSTNIVTYTCGTNCVPVNYAVWAKNNCNPNDIRVTTSPLSGTCFPPGVHVVDVWAYGSGQTNHCSFTVTVLPGPNCPPVPQPRLAIEQIKDKVRLYWPRVGEDLVLRYATSLDAKANWVPLNLPVQTNNSELSVTLPSTMLTAPSLYFQLSPRFPTLGLPDLIVKKFELTSASSVSGGNILVPVQVVVRNQGTGPAGLFKTAVNYVAPPGTFEFVTAFSVPGQADIWYPWTDEVLPAGAEVTFTGNLNFLGSLSGHTVVMRATADSDSGDEFLPDWVRVRESDEGNNRSTTVTVTLP